MSTTAAEFWAHLESLEAQRKQAAKLRAFRIHFGPRDNPRLVLDVMGESSGEVTEQHLCLRVGDERMDVTGVRK